MPQLVAEQPPDAVGRGCGCEEAVDGVFLARETITEQTVHHSLTVLALTGCQGSDSVFAERCDDLGRSMWRSPISAGVPDDRDARVDGREVCDSLVPAASRENQQHQRKGDPSHLFASPRWVRRQIVHACVSVGQRSGPSYESELSPGPAFRNDA
jgi:hypothetical protein